MEAFLTTAEAAAKLDVTSRRIRQLIEAGTITGAVRKGRDYLIPGSEIVRLAKVDRPSGRPLKEPKS